MKSKGKKGQNQKAVQRAKDLIDKGMGMSEVIELTGLQQEDVARIKGELEGRL